MNVNTSEFKSENKPNRARRRQLAKIAKKNPDLFTQFMNNAVFKPDQEGMNKLSEAEQADIKEQLEEQGVVVEDATTEDIAIDESPNPKKTRKPRKPKTEQVEE